jgi:ABC transporter substrate binding protein
VRRRDFIAVVGNAAIGWPLAARAQQKKIDRVGVLLLDNADSALSALILGVLRDELRKAGYVDQQNVLFDIVSAEGKTDQLPKLAATLVALKVDLIVALLTPSAHAAQQATREIPIVAYAGDPVGTGLVASLARPGGNITGVSAMTSELHGKCVELFKDMLPSTRRIGALINAADASSSPSNCCTSLALSGFGLASAAYSGNSCSSRAVLALSLLSVAASSLRNAPIAGLKPLLRRRGKTGDMTNKKVRALLDETARLVLRAARLGGCVSYDGSRRFARIGKCALAVAAAGEDDGQVVEGARHIRVVCAQCLLLDRQRALVERLGVGVPTLTEVQDG